MSAWFLGSELSTCENVFVPVKYVGTLLAGSSLTLQLITASLSYDKLTVHYLKTRCS